MAATFVTPFLPPPKPHRHMTGVFHPFLLHLYTLFGKQSIIHRLGNIPPPPQPFVFVVSAIHYQPIQFPNKMGKIHLKNFFPPGLSG